MMAEQPGQSRVPSTGRMRILWAVIGVALAGVVIFALTRPADGRGASTTAVQAPNRVMATSGTPGPSTAMTPSSSAGATSGTPSSGGASKPLPTSSAGTSPGLPRTSAALPVGTPRPTPPPVSLTATATPIGGVVTSLTRIEKIQGVSNLPGEIAGPSLRVTVRITNNTASPVDLSGTVVNLYTGKELTPALPLSQPGAKPFPSSVAAGSSADGVFVFNVPASQRSAVRIEVDLSSQGNVLLFQGKVT